MSSVEKRQAYWREAIEFCEPQVQVAIDGDKIVGFVGFDRSRDEKSRQTTGEIWAIYAAPRSEEHTSELQSQSNLVCRLLLEKKKKKKNNKNAQKQRINQ